MLPLKAENLDEMGQLMMTFYEKASEKNFNRLQDLIIGNEELLKSKKQLAFMAAVALVKIEEKNKWPIKESFMNSLIGSLKDKNSKAYEFLNSDKIISPAKLDLWWCSFFVTGEEKYLEKLYSQAGHDLEQDNNKSFLLIYGAASWSFKSNCKQNDRVKEFARKKLAEDELTDYKRRYLESCLNQ